MRLSILVSAALAVTPAMAQDVLGPVNPAGDPATTAVNQAIGAQARQRGGANFRGTGFSEAYVREQCAGLSRDRARYGTAHRRVVRWTRICRQARLAR